MNQLRLRVVLYMEDGLWVAYSLEMDVIGVGETQESATEELKSNIEAQLSFSKQEQCSPFRAAPAPIQNLWDEANLAVLGFPGLRGRTRPTATEFLNWTGEQLSKIPAGQFA
jgi:predicted RNase H-like HicB family nuclease